MSKILPRVLITGVNGQVGSALLTRGGSLFAPLGMTRAELDLSRLDEIGGVLDRACPDLVVNCAAYTAVDQAEREPEIAFAINGKAPGSIAEWCAGHGRPLIHLSTDYVFPGDAGCPYLEDDPIGPVSVYGASKAEGERQVRASGARHVILRTAWVYAANGKNFVRTMLRLGAERPELKVVDDQRGCPTAAGNIAIAVEAVVDRLLAGDPVSGTYHYVDDGETTWHGLAEHIFARVAPRWGRRPVLYPITTEQYPTPAKRPRYSVLDTAKFRLAFGVTPPAWEDSVNQVLDELEAPGGTGD